MADKRRTFPVHYAQLHNVSSMVLYYTSRENNRATEGVPLDYSPYKIFDLLQHIPFQNKKDNARWIVKIFALTLPR